MPENGLTAKMEVSVRVRAYSLLSLQHGADPKSLENTKDTPLLVVASIANMPRLIRESLSNEATPDALGAAERTPLTYAAKRGYTEIVHI